MTEQATTHNMEYNSSKERLIIPEYGRNVQMLINHAKTIEDTEEKQKFIERIVHLMMQMHPQNKNMEDYREKLWKHVFKIADYELDDVKVPEEMERPTLEIDRKRPAPLAYPDSAARFRHYGKNIQIMIAKAIEMEDEEKKKLFATVIGNYMKMAYRTWNREHYVSDEVIIQDLDKLSDGKLILEENTFLDSLTNSNRQRKKKHQNSGGRDNNHRNKGKGGRKKRY